MLYTLSLQLIFVLSPSDQLKVGIYIGFLCCLITSNDLDNEHISFKAQPSQKHFFINIIIRRSIFCVNNKPIIFAFFTRIPLRSKSRQLGLAFIRNLHRPASLKRHSRQTRKCRFYHFFHNQIMEFRLSNSQAAMPCFIRLPPVAIHPPCTPACTYIWRPQFQQDTEETGPPLCCKAFRLHCYQSLR